MTTDELKKLKENDLRKFSYTKTIDVVETLESLNLIDISGIAAHEEIETYISLTAIIKNRVDNDELQKPIKLLNRKNKDKDKDILRNRLININNQSTHDSEHTRYIIRPDQYKIINQNNNCTHDIICDCNKGDGTANNIEFTFAGNNYSFKYDESLLHDGNLYFCEEHEILE